MFARVAVTLFSLILLGGCEPEVGSDAWCENMAETPKSDWSLNDATAFAENCVLKTYDN